MIIILLRRAITCFLHPRTSELFKGFNCVLDMHFIL